MRLQQLADITGGQAFFPTTNKALDQVFDADRRRRCARSTAWGSVSTDARRRTARWRKLEVRLAGSHLQNLQMRTRKGYYAPSTRHGGRSRTSPESPGLTRRQDHETSTSAVVRFGDSGHLEVAAASPWHPPTIDSNSSPTSSCAAIRRARRPSSSRGSTRGDRHQVLLGVTGSGKTFTMAQVIARANRPTLVMAHNKTLAAQLYQEFKRFFPHNAVEYFVSYYDYYQPEAYVPASDTYIEKEATINDEIDRLRLSATRSLFERRDVIIVASVSCIYGLGSPEAYYGMLLPLARGQRISRQDILRKLVEIQYERNDIEFGRGTFRVRGDAIEVFPSYEEHALRIELFGDEIDELVAFDPLTGKTLPASRPDLRSSRSRTYVTPREQHQAGRRDDQGRAGERRDRPGAGRQAARSAAPAPAHDVRPRDDPRDRLLPRHRELLAAPDGPRAGRAAADAARLPARRCRS